MEPIYAFLNAAHTAAEHWPSRAPFPGAADLRALARVTRGDEELLRDLIDVVGAWAVENLASVWAGDRGPGKRTYELRDAVAALEWDHAEALDLLLDDSCLCCDSPTMEAAALGVERPGLSLPGCAACGSLGGCVCDR